MHELAKARKKAYYPVLYADWLLLVKLRIALLDMFDCTILILKVSDILWKKFFSWQVIIFTFNLSTDVFMWKGKKHTSNVCYILIYVIQCKIRLVMSQNNACMFPLLYRDQTGYSEYFQFHFSSGLYLLTTRLMPVIPCKESWSKAKTIWVSDLSIFAMMNYIILTHNYIVILTSDLHWYYMYL